MIKILLKICSVVLLLFFQASAGMASMEDDLCGASKAKILSSIEESTVNPSLLKAWRALKSGALYCDEQKQLWIKDDGFQPLLGNASYQEGLSLKKIRINNRIRRTIHKKLSLFQMDFEDDQKLSLALDSIELSAIKGDLADQLKQKEKTTSDAELRDKIALLLARKNLSSQDEAQVLEAISVFGAKGLDKEYAALKRLAADTENETFKKSITQAMDAIERRTTFFKVLSHSLYGLSLSSVLLLAALGLSVTFGLMGIINMAHGEMLMLGCYSAWFSQNIIAHLGTGWSEYYLLLAFPLGFLLTFMVGFAMENLIVRHLYKRPLDSLLATWGVSLVLIQAMRLLVGAQNVEVASPSWLKGSFVIATGYVLPYNRIFAISFAAVCFLGLLLFMKKSKFGLLMRATQSNREMAESLGINTRKIDSYTFALGSGIAGLGGVILSQIGNVGPSLGQSYIIDSFMVVVLGGVGDILGTLLGALTIGLSNKFLEPFTGAVFAKILVMILLIIFIQKRPQGLMVLKGRDS